MRWCITMVAVVSLLLVAGCESSEKPSTDQTHSAHGDSGLPVLTFRSAAGATAPLAVEVADDGQEMSCGLMHRTELPQDQGMLFVYAQDSNVGFWMRNTLLPLSIAYAAADGRIVDILDMAPVPAPGNTPFLLTDGRIVPVADGQTAPAGAVWMTYPPREPYRYAIEANQGWFAGKGIATGDHVDVSAALAAPDAAAPAPICVQRGL